MLNAQRQHTLLFAAAGSEHTQTHDSRRCQRWWCLFTFPISNLISRYDFRIRCNIVCVHALALCLLLISFIPSWISFRFARLACPVCSSWFHLVLASPFLLGGTKEKKILYLVFFDGSARSYWTIGQNQPRISLDLLLLSLSLSLSHFLTCQIDVQLFIFVNLKFHLRSFLFWCI